MKIDKVVDKVKTKISSCVIEEKIGGHLSLLIKSFISATIIGEDIEEGVKDTPPENIIAPVVTISPEKAQRYIERGVEEVAGIISDLNFELGDSLVPKKVSLGRISLPEDGGAVIEIKKILGLSNEEMAEQIIPKSHLFTLRPEFSKYIEYRVVPPAALSPEITVIVKVKIPKEVLADMTGEDTNWSKTGKVVEKYGKELLKKL